MESLSILFGAVFWPAAIALWVAHCKATKRPKRTLLLGLAPLIVLPVLGAASLGHYMFIDEPLYFAACEGDVRRVKHLLNWGADPNVDFEGMTALGCTERHPEVRRLLRQAGAR